MVIDYYSEIKTFREFVSSKKHEREILQRQIEEDQNRIKQAEKDLQDGIDGRAWIQKIVQYTQSKVSKSVGSLVSQALSSVFDDPYEFKVNFESRRNKTECDLLFSRDGIDFDPMDSSGGGAVDVASFALRLTFWALNSNLRSVLLLDEPFRFVSQDLRPYCSEMLKMMSQKTNTQIVMVTHLQELLSSANKIFNVEFSNGKTKVHTLE
jgi:DNA repair exonuclease SbcCD ATPase subunit